MELLYSAPYRSNIETGFESSAALAKVVLLLTSPYTPTFPMLKSAVV
jgi:hypothetical protein